MPSARRVAALPAPKAPLGSTGTAALISPRRFALALWVNPRHDQGGGMISVSDRQLHFRDSQRFGLRLAALRIQLGLRPQA